MSSCQCLLFATEPIVASSSVGRNVLGEEEAPTFEYILETLVPHSGRGGTVLD
jgi:hypothetical protein